MKLPKFPPQINRLLLLIFAIVISYLVARTILTPASFRDRGFYRGDALIERAKLDTTFAGKTALGIARPDILETLAKGGHKTLSCEACHGPLTVVQVAKGGKPITPPEGLCLRCHEANPTRPATFKQIVLKDHFEGKCIECHIPHQPAEAPPEPTADSAPATPTASPENQPSEVPHP